MKHKFILYTFILCAQIVIGQANQLSGLWQGMLIHAHQDPASAEVIYLEFTDKEAVTGFTRIELLNKEVYSVKSFEGVLKNDEIIIEEIFINRSTRSREAPTCKRKYRLNYNDADGYLSGSFLSLDCRNKVGEVVFYKADGAINTEEEATKSHYWKYQLAQNYELGLPAPKILEEERKNFEFTPIFFDHDESVIKPEFHDYLNKIARLLKGISDLRVEVVGHTDAVGTDAYNIGLSKRRAKAIKEYFLTQGVEEDKLEIDFKGERLPIDTNETPEGKQRNRRVDFKFI